MSDERKFSWSERAAEKAAARARDEECLASGEISAAELARKNTPVQNVRYIGPSKRIQRLASDDSDD